MGERLLIVLLAGTVGLLIGLLGPGFLPAAQQVNQAEQAWLYPATPTPLSTDVPLILPRAVVAQTAIPPTLTPASQPTAVPNPPTPVPVVAQPQVPVGPPPAQTFVIRLVGGGEMRVVANDRAAALNNVKSQGGMPAE